MPCCWAAQLIVVRSARRRGAEPPSPHPHSEGAACATGKVSLPSAQWQRPGDLEQVCPTEPPQTGGGGGTCCARGSTCPGHHPSTAMRVR
eukprot:CAMPEP_0174370584 /NCGR_PEP_ID=MMETSP0811_2-20130205/96579_1 /TAXON_ID=73025 ORGANISM="Eutreptiella gymnastica-like, Strain CCMP1594" /NCGR_SAMPLE_ID=MMETSP0811_2 /ASSEMBLY_ACC=CAM_ASM_000667 /LENGTH=89 /DNA_ID=CAMNT_0015516115 /DNA_START=90 /DNA_END=355 /DNA_ORIENTATION=+